MLLQQHREGERVADRRDSEEIEKDMQRLINTCLYKHSFHFIKEERLRVCEVNPLLEYKRKLSY